MKMRKRRKRNKRQIDYDRQNQHCFGVLSLFFAGATALLARCGDPDVCIVSCGFAFFFGVLFLLSKRIIIY